MAWHNWVLRKFSGAESPEEWVSIVTELKTILDNKLIDKIEFAAFVIRGSRKARWTIIENDPEYSSELNSMDAAKRLTQLLISSKEGPTITDSLKILLNLTEQKITKCPMCNKEIIISDFYKDGRIDPYSIQVGHKI